MSTDTAESATTEKQHPCPECPKSYTRPYRLARHIRDAHSREDEELVATEPADRTQPASSVEVGDVLYMFDGTQRTVTRKMNVIAANVTLYFGPFYWVTMPAQTPVRKAVR